MPISLRISALRRAGISIRIPSASSTSALPHLLETLLFPCFATGMPAAEITNAETVEILKVNASSPPVPTISSTSPSWASLAQCSRITIAQAVISSMLSPFMRIAVRKEAICALVARPSIISFMTDFVVSKERFSLLTRR